MDDNFYQNNGQNDQNNSSYNNQQSNNQNNGGNNPYGNYQDYTANVPYQPPVSNGVADNRVNGLQVAGLVCGILAICACWCYGIFSIILGIAGLICAIMGNKQGKNGVGIGGLVCAIIGLVLGVASLIYFIYVFMLIVNEGGGNMQIQELMEYYRNLQ